MRDADLGDLVFAAAEVEDFDQPRGGSDDDFCGDVRGHFSAHSYRADLVWLLAVSHAPIPTIYGRNSARPDVGRLRGVNLLHGVGAVLVHGLDPDLAVMRDRRSPKCARSATGCSRWAGRAPTGTGAIMKRPT